MLLIHVKKMSHVWFYCLIVIAMIFFIFSGLMLFYRKLLHCDLVFLTAIWIVSLINLLYRSFNMKISASWLYPCTRCGKPYRSKKAMYTHFKFSCENKRTFFCKMCSAAYFYNHHLQRHIRQQHTYMEK